MEKTSTSLTRGACVLHYRFDRRVTIKELQTARVAK